MDNRLKFNATGVDALALNWAFLSKIWVPDTYFINGKKSYLHKITVPNRFVRISANGQISYSQRLTLWASCPMDLRKFPLDSQVNSHLEKKNHALFLEIVVEVALIDQVIVFVIDERQKGPISHNL